MLSETADSWLRLCFQSIATHPAFLQLPDGAAGPAAGANTASDTWRRAYRERLGAEANWRAGRSGWQRLVGHRDYIRCAQLVDGVLASCSGSYLHKDCSIR